MSAESPDEPSLSPEPVKRPRGRPRGKNYEKNKRKTERVLQREATVTGVRYNVRICGRTYSAVGEHWIIRELKKRRDILRDRRKEHKAALWAIQREGSRLTEEARQIARLVGPGMELCQKCYSVNPALPQHPHPHFNVRTGEYSCAGNPVVCLGSAEAESSPAEPTINNGY